jgi:hypothetical protein
MKWENKKNNFSGKTSRKKTIIDVLIFRNGHVLHHTPTTLQSWVVVGIDDYVINEKVHFLF